MYALAASSTAEGKTVSTVTPLEKPPALGSDACTSLSSRKRQLHDELSTNSRRATTPQRARLPFSSALAVAEGVDIEKRCKPLALRRPTQESLHSRVTYNLNTVSDVIRHCRTFEALKTRRITPKFGRLANVTTVASVDASPQTDLSATIRQIVREELLRHEEQTRYAVPRCASVAFRDAVCASPPATWQHSVNAADCNSCRHDPHYGQTEQRHYDSIDRRFDQHPRDVRPRRPSTAYDIQGEGMSYSQPVAAVEYFNQRPEVRPLPVCYNCGTPGHIARYCNRRRAFSNGQSGSFMQHGGRAMDTNRPGNTTFEGYFREERSRHFPLDSYSGEQERSPVAAPGTHIQVLYAVYCCRRSTVPGMRRLGSRREEEDVTSVGESRFSSSFRQQVRLVIWDTGDSDLLCDPHRASCYAEADVVLVCFSVRDIFSGSEVPTRWATEVRHFNPNVPVLLVATQMDLREDPVTVHELAQIKCRPTSVAEGLQLAQKIQAAHYIECSSLDLASVRKVFESVLHTCLRVRSVFCYSIFKQHEKLQLRTALEARDTSSSEAVAHKPGPTGAHSRLTS
ncbi:hypothetical protein HPB51_024343 [Rhipicephalus microplus]|uniref:CCHC-type domain-containing protein n=1 Tax=Rhipicephalus microplus TaxID=6941 RepID=A0A9J6ED96_RHIMP|nr:hypothetical protein HPB51_024343 [Rhipicephalus microplus]